MITAKTLSACLKELYEFGFYNPKDSVEHHLLRKYITQLSPRQLHRLADLTLKGYDEGKQIFQDQMKGYVYKNNPFLKLIPKEDFSWRSVIVYKWFKFT